MIAVSEATYKAFKTEFVSQYQFETMAHLELECFDYVNWWNHHRIHSSLGYKTPIEVLCGGWRSEPLIMSKNRLPFVRAAYFIQSEHAAKKTDLRRLVVKGNWIWCHKQTL